MTDPKQIDSLTQLKLTKAIQKAASVALVSDKDRSQIIADQLDKDSVPKSLTKIATQAFNRRIAVATIGSRPDQEKAEDFPLADIDKVASLRGVQYMQKAASVSQAPFSFVLHIPQPAAMKKVASAQKEFPRMSWEQLQTKIQNYLQKQAAYINSYNLQLMSDQGDTQQLVKKASKQLQSDPKSKQLLYNVYTDAFHVVFPKLAQGMQKTAAYTILPDNQCVQTTERAILQSAVLQDKKDNFVKVAKELQKVVQSANKVQQAIYDGILHKKADGYTLVKDIAGNALAAPVIAGLGFGTGVASQTADTLQDAASAMFSKDYAVKPSSVITAKIINTDKYDDTKMALIKMLANKNFKAYKAKDIAKATLSQIANNTNFQSPKFNKALTAFVGNNLVNQGKQNLASLAAQANILKSLTQANKAQEGLSAYDKTKLLSDVKARQDIDLPTFKAVGDAASALHSMSLPYEFGKDLDQWKSQRIKDQEAILDNAEKADRKQAQEMKAQAQKLKASVQNAKLMLLRQGLKHNAAPYRNILNKDRRLQDINDIKDLQADQMPRALDIASAYFDRRSQQQKQNLMALSQTSKSRSSKSGKGQKTP